MKFKDKTNIPISDIIASINIPELKLYVTTTQQAKICRGKANAVTRLSRKEKRLLRKLSGK